jgi:hypothetical protein
MANTYTLIEAKTLTTTTASVTFSSIPSTYTDLLLRISSRSNDIYNEVHFRFNGSSTSYSYRTVYGTGSSTVSSNASNNELQGNAVQALSSQTANTFGSIDLYIPNYLSSNYKSTSGNSTQENNATASQAMLGSGLWSNTAAITSIQAFPSVGSFVQYSNFYLYGIKNS